MLQALPPFWRRLLFSVGYGVLIIAVVCLGFLTTRAVYERRHASTHGGTVAPEPITPLIEVTGLTARREKTTNMERLTISFRLRLTGSGNMNCNVYVVARNDHVMPRLWGVWPAEAAAGVITAAGNFRGGHVAPGGLQLTSSWSRIVASINHPPGHPPFETATVYVVGSQGDVLLARPFVL